MKQCSLTARAWAQLPLAQHRRPEPHTLGLGLDVITGHCWDPCKANTERETPFQINLQTKFQTYEEN